MAKAARFREATLRRRRAFIDQRARFLLVCEGANSEPLYFQTFGRTLRKTMIEPLRGAGAPITIAEKAIEEARKRGLTSKRRPANPNDQVWAVFDRDEHNNFADAVRKCEENGINVARSNPCFEVWLILHLEEFNRPDGRQAVFDHLCKLRPDYKEGKGRSCDFLTLIRAVEIAEQRAVQQLAAREAEGAPFGPPSTTVHELTKALRQRE